MKLIELFANYELRELLPKELISLFPRKIVQKKGNTILLSFENEAEMNHFFVVCRKYGFQYREKS